MEERIQKLMAEAGVGSRRDCEALIEAGRVTVNGRLAQLGEKADPNRDTIVVDGQPLKPAQQLVYIALYKPRGVLSAVESPDPRSTVRDLVPVSGRVYPVGRLDVDSEGLILLTNDGDLANRLTHPRYGHEKEYRVLVARRPDEVQLETWRRGVVLEDGYQTQPADVRMEGGMGKGAWLRIILREGRKRQIRETGSRIGLPVVKIIRVRIGSLTVGGLKPREWRYLTPQEVAALKGETAPAGRGAPGRRPARTPRNQPPARREGGASRSAPARRSPPRGGPGGRPPGGRWSEQGSQAERGWSEERRGGPGRPGERSRSEGRGGRGSRPESGGDAPGRGRHPASSGGRPSTDRWDDQGQPGGRSRTGGRGARSESSRPTGNVPDRERRSGRPGGRPSDDRWNDQGKPGDRSGSGERGGRRSDQGRPGERSRSEERRQDDWERSPQRGRPGDRPAAPGGKRPPRSGRRPSSGGSRPPRSGGSRGPRPGSTPSKKKR